jgi:hypothetical protein
VGRLKIRLWSRADVKAARKALKAPRKKEKRM